MTDVPWCTCSSTKGEGWTYDVKTLRWVHAGCMKPSKMLLEMEPAEYEALRRKEEEEAKAKIPPRKIKSIDWGPSIDEEEWSWD